MGIRKVNLSDLSGSLSKRGRERYDDPELREALQAMLEDGEAFIWDTAVVKGKTEKELTASKAMWRSRATSVLASIGEEHTMTIRWTNSNEMVISPKAQFPNYPEENGRGSQ